MNSVIGFLLVKFVTLIGIYHKREVCRACVVSQKEVWIWFGAVDDTRHKICILVLKQLTYSMKHSPF